MIRNIKKGDIILASVILFSVLLLFAVYRLFPRDKGSYAVVKINGKIEKRLSLHKEASYKIKTKKGTNLLEIKNGFASIAKADCPDKLCVHQREISKKGETIVCLPHKVIISIENDESSSSEPDAVVN